MRCSGGILVLAVFLTNAAFCFSPPSDSLRNRYVEEYPDKLYLKPIYTFRNLSLQLNSRRLPLKINYLPNGNAYFGFGVYLFNIGVEASLKVPQNSRRQSRYGKTEFIDFQSNIYAKKWGADLAVQKYQGFYLSNPSSHISTWKTTDPFPQRGDLNINNLSADVFYIANHQKFSYRSAYNQADRQLKSGGSFLIGINFLDQKILADSTLIPSESHENFDVVNFHEAHFTAIGITGGYTHSFVYRFLYLNFSIVAGPAHLWNTYEEDGNDQSKTKITPILHLRTAIGYNSPTWFGGFSMVTQRFQVATNHIDIRRDFGNIKLFLGYRFNEIGFLKKTIF